jgi:hypothetical protein
MLGGLVVLAVALAASSEPVQRKYRIWRRRARRYRSERDEAA